MSTKYLLATFCFFLFNFCCPAYSDMSVTIEKMPPSGVAVNTSSPDTLLTGQVRQALAKDFAGITVMAKDGVVTLSGKVADESAKASIEKIVASIPGVKSVNNNLEVSK